MFLSLNLGKIFLSKSKLFSIIEISLLFVKIVSFFSFDNKILLLLGSLLFEILLIEFELSLFDLSLLILLAVIFSFKTSESFINLLLFFFKLKQLSKKSDLKFIWLLFVLCSFVVFFQLIKIFFIFFWIEFLFKFNIIAFNLSFLIELFAVFKFLKKEEFVSFVFIERKSLLVLIYSVNISW